jgi:predicted dehydrogenase
MRQLGIGIIGFGMMGKTHTYAYRNLPFYYSNLPYTAKLVGVCSGHLANAQQAARDFSFQFATDDYREILGREDIDVVSICTPNNLHLEMILGAIQAGKHIYCDKPLAASVGEADIIGQALAGYPGIHQMVHHIRFYPAILRAGQLIDEGRLGRVVGFRAAYLHSSSVDPLRPAGWKMGATGGGVILDLASHVLDLIYSLIGPFSRISASSQILYNSRPDRSGGITRELAEDSVLMLAELQNGARGTLEASKIATGCNDELRLEIHGDRGALRFNLMDPNGLDFYDAMQPDRPLGGDRGFVRIESIGRYELPASGFPSEKASIGWLRGHVHCL